MRLCEKVGGIGISWEHSCRLVGVFTRERVTYESKVVYVRAGILGMSGVEKVRGRKS